jgi:hypothetical protein
MKTMTFLIAVTVVAAGSFGPRGAAQKPAQKPAPTMSFFITSMGLGDGANLGGLTGADAHCRKLASAVGAGNRAWRAYLSAPAANGQSAVHARDRIGKGPWFNAKGVQVAASLADLHSDNNKLGKENSLTEKGEIVIGAWQPGNRHDILTGSNPDGTLASGDDVTCNSWTDSTQAGRAMLGHHDKDGGGERPASWNSAHLSEGCSQRNLVPNGGAGLFYCFAAD